MSPQLKTSDEVDFLLSKSEFQSFKTHYLVSPVLRNFRKMDIPASTGMHQGLSVLVKAKIKNNKIKI